MIQNAIAFSKTDKTNFIKTLNKKVNSYFKDNHIKRTGNRKLYLKTVIIFSVFLVPFTLILTLNLPQWVLLLMSILVGIGMAGVGMNVMHDGNHGTFSSKKWVNKLMGSSIYILAGNVYNWKVQHNVLHHTYTNIPGYDEDIDAGRIIRFSSQSKWFKIHKFQKYYSFFLYGLLTINWAITTDFIQMRNYLKRKLSCGAVPNPVKEWTLLITTKIAYYLLWIVLPLVVLDLAWWKVLIGFFVMHYTAGIILSIIFQLAHVVPKTEMPIPDKAGNLDHTWAVHQLYTTANFAPNNKFISWYAGGLNHQVEHHIFPNISHIHYQKIASFVKETASEFNLPYNEYQTMRSAVIEHYKLLKSLGKKPSYA
ncbi:MAG: acyl-CoA desaturase [Flavobacteriales bacterium CG_4_9_14_0_2_um_filter_35_242]|nr:acyl-CoA desaturase [Zetaproteobacteria bacterium]NDK17850.1 acyl-CoA desaturase [Flavobacteriales bacterium]OIO10788.1 MAG: acyl-CoA desaturase [Flavobacteriaceae bacterium CG1_02_35_72]PIR12653.1 MAG: acyl-CoA desaturase [Flavobacteriales bacterium CG11_big_fil_rev_8_21_14_0_20_35_7]PIV17107.1 MAG: acyl-CoA desaturase [Flavobacteriales bacterium CG03_land_8_20_14_0_80_35_15]PIX07582.1 MAG: acyl-CoA desaturase [Flavobacteriales bacterium CG_4_8_14_3_um_filter_35_10]PJC60666.1 MAG: acyl-Co